MLTPGLSYGRALTERAAAEPDGTAFVHVATTGVQRRVSWGELERRANQIARLLDTGDVAQGSIVAVALPNIPDHFFASYGAWKLGATVLPLRWSLPAWELARLVELARPAAVVSLDGGRHDPRAISLEQLRGSRTLDDSPLPDRVANPAQAIATSGSTGRPKLIVRSIPAVVRPRDSIDAVTIEPAQVVQLVTSPLYHTNGFIGHVRLMSGGRLVVMEKFDAANAVDLIERWQVNHVVLVPTMLQRIARLPDLDPTKLASLELVFYGGAPLAPWVARRWLELVAPHKFIFQYGGTEAIGSCMARGDEWLEREGTVGRPVGCELRIQDEHGRSVPPGTIGEIYLRSDPALPAFRYLGAPMPPSTGDGFTTYGDLGWVDPDGYLFVADRRVDMVVTGGANVYPAEVEAALSEHPAVADAVVVGLPDPEWGRRVHAIVEPTDPDRPPSAQEIRQHCRDRLAAYKVPKSVEIVDTLPRSEAGKLNRSALIADREAVSQP